MIELKSVTKKYGKHTIVRDVNCIYENGKVYGLIGYNGSGKAASGWVSWPPAAMERRRF